MLLAADALFVLTLALVLDALIGDPDALWRRVPHPVAWFGAIIAAGERRFNRAADSPARRRALGVASLVLTLAITVGSALILHKIFEQMPFGLAWEALLASVLIAQRSLHEHVARVAAGLARDGLPGGRKAVSMIVGRDPESLDEAGVSRAAIESTAENFSDGVVAPVFWFALAGFPGLVFYKTVNTADSMIGHLNDRYRHYGWAAARLDDLINLVPARLAALLIAAVAPVVGGSPAASFRIMLRDAGLHRSPNAGWPEAAMAGALGLALAGPRRYGARMVEDQFLYAEGRNSANEADIRRALSVLIAACALQGVLIAVAALLMRTP
jgi:adenosylcobinamide-phosphate synthase